ncbi:MAG: type IV pilus assembly protein PilM [Candidatus Colwellbacteria bacterium]|nr:type IV pilus assembly protein PilM [Candidatus Colwellbacteria bacterium]
MALLSFGAARSIVGVDIGTTSIKIVELVRGKPVSRLVTYGILETHGYLTRPNEAIQASTLRLSEENTASYLKLVVSRAGVKTKRAVASIPAFLAFSTLVEVPTTSESEIKKFVEHQAKQYIPLPMASVAFDWVKVGERTEAGAVKSQVLLIAIPTEHVERYRRVFAAAGLDLELVELEGMSHARALAAGADEQVLIIDVGSRSTSISVAQNGFLKFSSQTDFAGGSLTHLIARGLNINARRAEDLKKQRGLSGFGGQHELSTLMTPTLDVILNEAKRVRASYESAYGGNVSRIVLTGGGSLLVGFTEYAGKQFDVPVEQANPLARIIYPGALTPIEAQTGAFLSVALGVALRAVVR